MKQEFNESDRVGWTSADNVKMEGLVFGSGVGPKEGIAIIGIDSPTEFYGRVCWLPVKNLTLVEKYKSKDAQEEDEDDELEEVDDGTDEKGNESEEDAEGYF